MTMHPSHTPCDAKRSMLAEGTIVTLIVFAGGGRLAVPQQDWARTC